MVIKYPTGLYAPHFDQATNRTWYISNNPPPRSAFSFIRLPVAEAVRPMPPKLHDDEDRRKSVAELVFSIIQTSQTQSGSSMRQFEVGQVLGFDEDLSPVISVPTNSSIEIRHDTNVLDLSGLGMSEDEINTIYEKAFRMRNDLNIQFESARTRVENLQISITENQKKINEAAKAIDAVTLIGDETILKELQDKQVSLMSERDQLVQEYEKQSALSDTLKDQIRQISQMVR